MPLSMDFDGFEAPNLNALAICHTKLEELSFKSFHVPTLQWLHVSHNRITSLDLSIGFQTLQWLDVSHNRITSLDLPIGFQTLEWLDVSHNRITSLDLSIGFQTLEWLDISHNRITSLDLSISFHTLQWLDISHNRIASLDPLIGFQTLEWLDISHNRITSLDLSIGFQALQWLDISNNRITSLDLSIGFQILEWLDISHNRITSLDLSFGVHKLQWLNTSYNNISELDISKLQPLYNLDISHQEKCFSTNKTLPSSLTFVNVSGTQLCSQQSICLFHVEFVNQRSKMLTEFFKEHFFDPVKRHLLKDIYDLLNLLHLSPTTDFDADVRKIEESIVESRCTNITEKVDIRYLDLRDNDIEFVHPSLFNQYDWSALNILDLAHNKLGSISDVPTITSHFWDFLMPLWNLTDLYLDSNHLCYVLQPNMLLNQTNLQSLHLSDTMLTHLIPKMHQLTDLHLLDISNNNIQCLYNSEMRDISKIIHHSPRRRNVSKVFEMNLSYNPLRCSCSCLPFYLWMRKVRLYINFTDFSSYRCTFDNGTDTDLSDLHLIVGILHSQCLSTDWSPVVSTTTTVLIAYTLILIAATSFRFRHTLRYHWLKHKMHRQYLERHILDPKYCFDAFVSCERTDAIWVKRNFLPKLENQQTGLKFCVAQRNFLVGGTIIDNIVRSINQSRKVVYVFSQNFLKSGWCKEELLMGHQESLSRGKNILICIFMPDIIHNQLPDRFRFILNEITCIKWPRDPAAQQVFWIMLQRALLDGQHNRNEV